MPKQYFATMMLFWKLLWIVSIVSLNVLLSTATINCVSNDYELPLTQQEINSCRYYGMSHYLCKKPRLVQGNISTCNAWRLESYETLKIASQNPKIIIFKNSSITTIPSRFFEEYSSLQQVFINASYVSEIDLNAFNGLTNLEQLYLQNNEITEIGKGTFNSLVNLITLDISNNGISAIEKKSFHGLTHLEVLDISHNVIQNISDDMFDHNLKSLRAFNLSHNFISTIEFAKILNFFSQAKQNLQLDLSYNRLKSLNLAQLTLSFNKVILNNNNLDTIGDFESSFSVKHLDLSNNLLSKLDYVPENIRYLNLSGNILQDFNISLPNSNKIEILDIGQNLIKRLTANTFNNMSSLTNLCLRGNQLEELPIGLFKNLKNLEVLSLSGNHLKHSEFGIFTGLSNLLELDISNNSFTSFDYKTLHSFKNLKVLNIANNQLRTLNPYDILNHCKNLEMVIINNNPWNCESLLNFTMVLTGSGRNVQVMEGPHTNIKNHLGHACADVIEDSDNKIDNSSYKNEVNSVTKFFEIGFRNSSFYHYFENYKNHTESSQANDYFNKDFKNTSFYKFFNKNISTSFPNKYDESFQNLTNILNLLNLKLVNLNESSLISELPKSNQINFEEFDHYPSNFSNLNNTVKKTTVDWLNSNLEQFSQHVNDIISFVKQEPSFYKLVKIQTIFIALVAILIIVFLIAKLFPVLIKCTCPSAKNLMPYFNTSRSTTNLELV